MVIVIANAKTQPPESLDEKESPPSLTDVIYKTATISMDNYSLESVQVLSNLLKISERAARNILECQNIINQQCSSGFTLPPSGHNYKVTVVEVNFLNIKDNPDEKGDVRRQRLLGMPTSFKLEKDQVDELIAVGGELLEQSAAFQKLLSRIQ